MCWIPGPAIILTAKVSHGGQLCDYFLHRYTCKPSTGLSRPPCSENSTLKYCNTLSNSFLALWWCTKACGYRSHVFRQKHLQFNAKPLQSMIISFVCVCLCEYGSIVHYRDNYTFLLLVSCSVSSGNSPTENRPRTGGGTGQCTTGNCTCQSAKTLPCSTDPDPRPAPSLMFCFKVFRSLCLSLFCHYLQNTSTLYFLLCYRFCILLVWVITWI